MILNNMNNDNSNNISAPNALEAEKMVSEKTHPKISAILFA